MIAIANDRNSEPKFKVNVKHSAYLTVDWYRDIHDENASYGAHKSEYTREGVNLSSEKFSVRFLCGRKKQK